MRRYIALLLAGAILVCSSCSSDLFSNKEETTEFNDDDWSGGSDPLDGGWDPLDGEPPSEDPLEGGDPFDEAPDTTIQDDTAPNEFAAEAKLYTVKEAFEKAFAFLGDTEADVDNKLRETYGLSIVGIKHELTGHTNYNVAIAQLLNDVQIPNEAVDWTTNYTYKNLQLPSGIVDIPIDIIKDRDEFVKYIDTFGIADYLFLGADAVGAVNPDFTLMEQLLSPDYNPAEHIGTNATFDPNGNFRITRDGANIPNKSYYSLTVRDNMAYCTYHPTIVDATGKGLYMKDESQFTKAPLWQCYFMYYADLITRTFGIDTKGFVNKTEDGIEIWWGIATGKTVELDVYPTGFIRILLTHDNFLDYNEYQPAVTTSNGEEAAPEESAFNDNFQILYNALSATYGLSYEQWSDIVDLAKELNSPLYLSMSSTEVIDSEEIPSWNAFISNYLETIDKYAKRETVPTILEYYKAIFKLAGIEQPEVTKKNIDELFAKYVEIYSMEDESLKTAFVNHPDWISEFEELLSGLKVLVGKAAPINLDTSWLSEEPAETTTAEDEVIVVEEESSSNDW